MYFSSMIISEKILEELYDAKLITDRCAISTRLKTDKSKAFGLVQLANDEEGYVIRPVMGGFIDPAPKVPNKLTRMAYPHLSDEERENQILWQFLKVDIQFICYESSTGKVLPREEWYDKANLFVKDLLVKYPELKWDWGSAGNDSYHLRQNHTLSTVEEKVNTTHYTNDTGKQLYDIIRASLTGDDLEPVLFNAIRDFPTKGVTQWSPTI